MIQAKDISIVSRSNADAKSDGDRYYNTEMYQVFVRLTVVYIVAILSTFVTYMITGLVRHVVDPSGNEALYDYWFMWSRILLTIDLTINICCLLFQHNEAVHLYKKACSICHSCVITICKNSSKPRKTSNHNKQPVEQLHGPKLVVKSRTASVTEMPSCPSN